MDVGDQVMHLVFEVGIFFFVRLEDVLLLWPLGWAALAGLDGERGACLDDEMALSHCIVCIHK